MHITVLNYYKQKFVYKGFVELEGFEPSSKRGSNLLSTCLALFRL